MVEKASIGIPGEAVSLVHPHMESDPHELHLRAHTLLGNNIARGPHIQVENTPYARNRPVLKVGDSAITQKRTSEERFPYLFVIEDWSRCRFHYDGVLRVVPDKISERRKP